MTHSRNGPLRVGIGGPVGTGKTALMDALCKRFRASYDIAAITNDIYTKEDAEFLTRAGSLPPERILGHRDRRLPAHRDPRGRLDQPCRRRRPQPSLSGARPHPDRIRRRQPGGDLQSGTGRPDDLRDRRLGRRQDPAQGRARHHAQRPAGDQQDRPGPVRRRQPGGDGPRRAQDARRAAVRVRQYPRRHRRARKSPPSSRPKVGSAQSRRRRSRSALPITETELNDMASAAMTGLSRTPMAGYSTPAAIGTPTTL